MSFHPQLGRAAGRLGALLLLPFLLPGQQAARAQGATPGVVWVEGEAPASVSPADLKPEISDDGQPTYLSGSKWLHVNVDAANVEKQVPAEGIVLSYKFTMPQAANDEIWDRIGFENARSDFDWRVDGGAWATVHHDDRTSDVMQLQTWNPVGWIMLARQQLGAGPHTLDIRLPRHKDDKGSYTPIQYASDALCISPTAFRPNGPYQPGDVSWQTDADRAAAAKVFAVVAPTGEARTMVPLSGDWQIARDDEGVVSDPSGPIKQAPDANSLFWKSMPVPGNRDAALPQWVYSHRYWLRTRLDVPADQAGRSFHLHFPAVNMIATVFVNGQSCGYTKTPFAAWDCDITRAVKPGQANEVWVGIKDTFYSLPSQGAKDGDYLHYLPADWIAKYGPADFTFPVWNHTDNGILRPPTLIVAGPAYTSDVFALPSVQNKSLGLEVTVHNPTPQAITVSVANEVVPLAGGPAAKTFAPKDLSVPAGGDAVLKLSEAWPDPKLWWPDDPNQYNVVTRLSAGGKTIDEVHTKFGFREWTWNGPDFVLNGVPFHGHADLADYGRADEEAVKVWKAHGQAYQRMWGEGKFSGLDPEDALDFYDSHGVAIRRTGILDGEAARYYLTGADGKVRPELFANWQAQLLAWAKGQRNHPSIFIWSIENEIAFINAHVFGLDPIVDPAERDVAKALLALDPTRPAMTDGGNALLDESMPVYGGHYMEPAFQTLPEGAYDDRVVFAHRQVWPVTQPKPILLGESYFAAGNEPADFATIGGESAFVGKAEARPAIGLTAKMLSEGYRWSDVNFQFWMGGESDAYYNSWQPVAVLCRQWDWSFASGQKVSRTLGIFNDTHSDAPITLAWTLTLGGKTIATQSSVHHVGGGMNEKFNVTLPMPTVTTRQEGQWTLTLTRDGHQVFKDVKAVSVLPTPQRAVAEIPGLKSWAAGGGLPAFTGAEGTAERRVIRLARAGGQSAPRQPRTSILGNRPGDYCPAPVRPAKMGGLAIYDPAGTVAAFLRGQGTPFTTLKSLATLPSGAKVLVIGKDALSPAESTSSKLAAYAAGGRTVIVLEQKNPLRFQALPGDMAADTNAGDIAFAEDLDSPVLKGLKQKDFFAWGADGTVYRNAYAKPTSGGKSLIQCDYRLQDTALAQMQAGPGLVFVSQLMIGQKLAANPVAQTLLRNMIAYGAQYKLTFKPVSVAAGDNPQLVKALDATGLRYSKAADPLAVLAHPGTVAVINATPAVLHTLAGNASKIKAFTQGGGWLILNNVTPEGLADYNKIVGVDHIIRPFHQEKVSFPATRNPLTAGLSTSNIVLGSGKQILDFNAGQYPDTDAFSYVVDYDDVAPFATSPFASFANIVNGYTMADGFWPLIINFAVPKDGSPYDVPMTLARPEKITEFTWVSDLNYAGTTKVNLVLGGKTYPFATQPNGDPQTFSVPDAPVTNNVTLQIADWVHDPAKQHDGQDLVGIDNIYLKAYRSPDFYKKVRPMLNIGAMMEYPQGAGGVVLCNVKFKDTEANPENVGKKQAIIATVLRNLGAPFTGGKTIIAGANNLTDTPLDLSKQANQYKNEQGWFGDKNFTFADLPGGRHTFAGVTYNVYNFTTSPVPTVIMLGGGGIPGNLPDHVDGIPVGRKADALFFLQAARIDQRRNGDEVKNNKRYEMADYVVHYADGQSVKIPVYAEINVDDYHPEGAPAALPGAQIAWTKPYPDGKHTAVAYSMQWNNPRPSVPIQSIDLTYGPDRGRGVPALIAVTAATAGP